MIRISYSGAAIKDLEQIGDYIAGMLRNPQAALNTVSKIQDVIGKLANYPHIGTPLSSIYEVDTDYRFLVCGNYLAFYRLQESEVLIDRILNGRQSYLVILLGSLPQDDTE
jgi:plasmid stabilization system protein ParE